MRLVYILILFSTTIFYETATQIFDIKIQENTPENVFISDLNTFDHYGSDSNKNKQFTLISSLNPKVNTLFILKSDGKLHTSKLIDRESLCVQIDECCQNIDLCKISILVAVSSPSMVSPRTFECPIQIEDQNDNAPKFPQSKVVITIPESEPVGTLFTLPLATDSDSDKFSIKQYKLIDESSFPPIFSLDQTRPNTNRNLQLIQRLDREKTSSYELTLLAIDGGNPPLTGKLIIEIKVSDVNDNPPILVRKNYAVNQKEGEFLQQALLTIEAKDDDDNENAQLFFRIINENPSQNDANKYFRIENHTGKIFLNQALDYERQERYRFFVEVYNKDSNIETATATVLVNVENINDEKPEIGISYLNMDKNNADIQENDVRTKFVALATVSDKDKGIGGQVVCKLLNFDDTFEIHIKDLSRFPNQYNIQTKISLDREKIPYYKVIMECEDKGYPILKTKKEINVRVRDLNDNAPVITIDKNISVKENSPRGFLVTKIQAGDVDEGLNGQLVYSISDSEELTLRMLEIDATSGELRTKEIIDRERDEQPLTQLTVTLTVSDKGKPPMSSCKTFTVKIDDENDNSPVFANELIQFSVTENQQPRFTLGEIPVSDKDDESQLRVTLAPMDYYSNTFLLFKKDNKFYLNTTRSLDWEKERSFSLKVIASDSYGYKSHTVTAEIRVNVIDENDNSPSIIFPIQKNFTVPRLSYHEKSGFTVLTVSAVDKDSPETQNGKVSFQLSDSKDLFMIDSITGAIKTSRPMTRLDMGRFEIKVIVRDNGTPQRQSSINLFIEVDDSKPQLNNESYNDNEENALVQSNNYLWTKEGFLVISLIILLLFLLLCVFMILYMRHMRGLFPVLPDLFLVCRRATKNRNCSKSGSCGKAGSHTPFDPHTRNSPINYPQIHRSHLEKGSPPYYLNQCDISTNNSADHNLPVNPYRQYETMKYQHYSAANPNAIPNVGTYSYDKLFYSPSTSHCDSGTFQRPRMETIINNNNNTFYDSRSHTNNNLPGWRRIVNNIEGSPLVSDHNIKESFNERFSSDPCLKFDDAERQVSVDKSVMNTPDLRGQARLCEKIDTYAITYPVEQSTFV